jgi:hypothetical protein
MMRFSSSSGSRSGAGARRIRSTGSLVSEVRVHRHARLPCGPDLARSTLRAKAARIIAGSGPPKGSERGAEGPIPTLGFTTTSKVARHAGLVPVSSEDTSGQR